MKQTIQAIIVGFLLLIIGCSHTLPPNLPIWPVSQYNFFQEREGLKIAVDPFFEKERLKEYFDADLLSYGILPVHIIIENRHPKFGYLFDKTFFSIEINIQQQTDTKESTESTIPIPQELSTLRSAILPLYGPGVIFPIFGVPVLALDIYSSIKETNIKKINENLTRNAFIDRTVFPDESHSGFVYFKISNREDAQKVSNILIKAKQILSDKEIFFVFQTRK